VEKLFADLVDTRAGSGDYLLDSGLDGGVDWFLGCLLEGLCHEAVED